MVIHDPGPVSDAAEINIMTRKFKERPSKHLNSLPEGTTGLPTRMAITQYQKSTPSGLVKINDQSRWPPSAPGVLPLLETFCTQWLHPRRKSLNITHRDVLAYQTRAREWGHGTAKWGNEQVHTRQMPLKQLSTRHHDSCLADKQGKHETRGEITYDGSLASQCPASRTPPVAITGVWWSH
jgi:hypothetical protein